MRTMHDLVSDILELSNDDLQLLAEALVTFSPRGSNKAFLLENYIHSYRSLFNEVIQDHSVTPSRAFILS